ncbi:hypothetical protein A3Q56_06780 [Intoshia linei]|uniref:Uncharacterized protein n=1 Tax=Intoshia linei TaxID=1819745 RepID=A0A177AU00_9BILA|nr:hypothetical protein A3Q56_06780 [Intoshia linei]
MVLRVISNKKFQFELCFLYPNHQHCNHQIQNMEISNENIKEWYKEVNPNSPFQFTGNFGLQNSNDRKPENILPIDIFNQIIDDKIIN